MFNEGIHVADVDGVILFRPTISPIIYKQQIGRALSKMKEGMLHATRYAAENGDLNVPTKYVCVDGFKLGSWIERMRRRKCVGKK